MEFKEHLRKYLNEEEISSLLGALDYAKSIRETWKQVMQASVRGKMN